MGPTPDFLGIPFFINRSTGPISFCDPPSFIHKMNSFGWSKVPVHQRPLKGSVRLGHHEGLSSGFFLAASFPSPMTFTFRYRQRKVDNLVTLPRASSVDELEGQETWETGNFIF